MFRGPSPVLEPTPPPTPIWSSLRGFESNTAYNTPRENNDLFSTSQQQTGTSSPFARSNVKLHTLPSWYARAEKRRPRRRGSSPPRPMGSYSWWRLKRLLSRPLPWILALVFVAFTWWGAGATQGFRPHVQQRLRNIFPSEYTKDLQFIPASNPKIHVGHPFSTHDIFPSL